MARRAVRLQLRRRPRAPRSVRRRAATGPRRRRLSGHLHRPWPAPSVPGLGHRPGLGIVEADADLVRIHLPDLATTLEEDGVVAFIASDDARYLVLQVLPLLADNPYHPSGTLYIRDREQARDVGIGIGSLDLGIPVFYPGFALVRLSDPDREVLISLPDFDLFEVPQGHTVLGPIADGRWMTSTVTRYNGPWHLLTHTTGETTQVSTNAGLPFRYSGDHLDLLGREPNTTQRTLSPIFRIPYDGARTPVERAPRATFRAGITADDRIVTMVAIDDDRLGPLAIVDPTTQQEQRIDDHVIAGTDLDDWQLPGAPETLVYGVVDGDRTGVWLARPAPRD